MAIAPFVNVTLGRKTENASLPCFTVPSIVDRRSTLLAAAAAVALAITWNEAGALVDDDVSSWKTLPAGATNWVQSFVRSPSSKSSQNLGTGTSFVQ